MKRLTPADLINPSAKSGYDHVRYDPDGSAVRPFRAGWGARNGPGTSFHAQRRATALEAAQDYCDKANGKKITPADITSATNESGYRFVWRNNTKISNSWKASVRIGTNRHGWSGPNRKTPLEAAQDYCDYVNRAKVAAPVTTPYEMVKVDLGTTKVHAPKQAKQKSNRKVHTGAHDLYDVLLYDSRDTYRRKVGITAVGKKRHAGTAKTWGFSIKPVRKAVTYPTKAAAEAAERKLIAKLCKDPAWKRVGKEVFVPSDAAAKVAA